jgi:hypothetical protein
MDKNKIMRPAFECYFSDYERAHARTRVHVKSSVRRSCTCIVPSVIMKYTSVDSLRGIKSKNRLDSVHF